MTCARAQPASHLNGTGYEEYLFRDRMTEIIGAHDAATPCGAERCDERCCRAHDQEPEHLSAALTFDAG